MQPQQMQAALVDVADAVVDNPRYIDMLAAAFYKATDIPPECCALVTKVSEDGDTAYFFVRFLGINDDGSLCTETVQHYGWIRRQVRRLVEAVW